MKIQVEIYKEFWKQFNKLKIIPISVIKKTLLVMKIQKKKLLIVLKKLLQM